MKNNKNAARADMMSAHLAACEHSGMAVKAYCKQHQLTPSNFYYWKKRLQCKPSNPLFTQVLPDTDQLHPIAIAYPNGVRVELAGSANVSVIKELICCI